MKIIPLKDGLAHGICVEKWKSSNRKIAEYTMKNGKLNGVSRTYYENGQIETEIEFKNDLEHGQSKFYDKNGILKARYLCVEGEIQGEIELK